MGMFGDLDLQDALDENPFEIPTDMYDLIVSDVAIKPGKKDPNKKYLVLEFTIQGGDKDGLSVQDWKEIPSRGDESQSAKAARYYLSNRLASLGIPPEKMDEVEPNDLLNIEVTAMVVKNGDFSNLSNKAGEFRLRDALPDGTPFNEDSDGMSVFAGSDD